MGRVIRLHATGHRDLQDLLPWYVTGQLEVSEHAQVEAHLRTCAECQAEVRFQRRLDREITELPVDVEQGWQAMLRRLEPDPPRPARRRPGAWLVTLRGPAPWLGWATAAALLMVGAVLLPISSPPARYHALGAAPSPPAGNVVVMFRPETREKDLREALRASHARLVDGPTVADAYVLQVPAGERPAILAKLRRRPDVMLAQPIDPGDRR